MGLRNLFSRSKTGGDLPGSYQSRVFLVTDENVRNEIYGLMARQDKKGFNALLGLSCPGFFRCLRPGLFVGHNMAEAVIFRDEMYITVPSVAHMEREYNEPALTAELKAWRPLLALREVDPAILGPAPFGFPRVGLLHRLSPPPNAKLRK